MALQSGSLSAAIELSGFTPSMAIDSLPLPAGQRAKNYSGVAYNGTTGSVFVVDSRNSGIYEYSANGDHLRTISTSGFVDVEGIAWMGGNRFAVVEEGRTTISTITLGSDVTSVNRPSGARLITPDLRPALPGTQLLNRSTDSNSGIEGITYDSTRNRFYVVKEQSEGLKAMGVYSVDASTGAASLLFDVSRSVVADLADLYFDALSDQLFLLSEESKKVLRTTLAGEVLETMKTARFGRTLEGITMSPFGDRMFLVGEEREMYRFNGPADTDTASASGFDVPEPASVAVWGLLLGGVGLAAIRRRAISRA